MDAVLRQKNTEIKQLESKPDGPVERLIPINLMSQKFIDTYSVNDQLIADLTE